MHSIAAKTILSARNGMNLYRGCTHGCIYCDSRSVCYGMEHDFEDVAVKVNAIELLDDALGRKRKPCMIGMGSMCDPYMHCEERLCLTRHALETAKKHNCGITLITKSDRVLRDLDLLEQINRKTKAVVQMTLTTADEGLCKLIEPNVCTTRRRAEALKELNKHGIPTVVWMTPILPFINDTADKINGLLDYCFEANVNRILNFGFGVTLREGDREYFYKKLDEHFKGVKQRYIKCYGNAYECTSDNSDELWQIFRKRCKERNVITDQKEIFAYLEEYPKPKNQISFFDEDNT